MYFHEVDKDNLIFTGVKLMDNFKLGLHMNFLIEKRTQGQGNMSVV
jgi:hypothetical protein